MIRPGLIIRAGPVHRDGGSTDYPHPVVSILVRVAVTVAVAVTVTVTVTVTVMARPWGCLESELVWRLCQV